MKKGDKVKLKASALKASTPKDAKRFEGRIGVVSNQRLGEASYIFVDFPKDGRRQEVRRLMNVYSIELVE